MSESTPPLTPMHLGMLLRRIEHEWDTRKKIFDLPTARFWKPEPDIDLGFEFLGRPCATPIGPAAGPHSQLAQNIVLSWLGGSRLFELKTVQILDELEIGRPCIDMETIGYNIEWSQELRISQSVAEYVTASMLIEMLRQWQPLAEFIGPDPGPHVFDMSVGYDLAGISSEQVHSFIRSMRDATTHIDDLRGSIDGSFASMVDYDFNPVISDTLTLSTFHGCPPDEIESITKHLIDEHELDVIVKLNPTLLGYETVADIVNTRLGYADVAVKESAFAEDLQFDRGVELIGELNDYAAERGRRFGIKLTNTLVVDNTRGFMPDETMYLSGPPLHVLASTLLDRLATALPGVLDIPTSDGRATDNLDATSIESSRANNLDATSIESNRDNLDAPSIENNRVMVSYSAGITKANLANTIATGVNPATVCSDLLKPGGYGRLQPMLRELTKTVRDAGATDLAGFRATRQREAIADGHATTAAAYAAQLASPAGASPYHLASNEKLPRAVDETLEMFGCVACNFCITVCPNDAFFSVPTPDWLKESLGDRAGRQQYLVASELCNECGNCMVFCPEDGDPAMIKPRLYLDDSVYAGRADQGQGVLLHDGGITGQNIDDEALELIGRLLTASGNPLGPDIGESLDPA